MKKIIKSAKMECKIIHVNDELKFAVIETTEDMETIKGKLLKNSIVEYIKLDYVYQAMGVQLDYILNDPCLNYVAALVALSGSDKPRA